MKIIPKQVHVQSTYDIYSSIFRTICFQIRVTWVVWLFNYWFLKKKRFLFELQNWILQPSSKWLINLWILKWRGAEIKVHSGHYFLVCYSDVILSKFGIGSSILFSFIVRKNHAPCFFKNGRYIKKGKFYCLFQFKIIRTEKVLTNTKKTPQKHTMKNNKTFF